MLSKLLLWEGHRPWIAFAVFSARFSLRPAQQLPLARSRTSIRSIRRGWHPCSGNCWVPAPRMEASAETPAELREASPHPLAAICPSSEPPAGHQRLLASSSGGGERCALVSLPADCRQCRQCHLTKTLRLGGATDILLAQAAALQVVSYGGACVQMGATPVSLAGTTAIR